MRCSTDKLICYIDNTLPDDKAREVEEHLKKCEVCREAYNTFKMIEAFEENHEEIPVDITSKVMGAIDKDKYSNKKYRYFNKFVSNRKSIYRGVAAAGFALIFTGSLWFAKEMNFFDKIRTTAELEQTNEKSTLDNSLGNKEDLTTFVVNKDMIKNSDINLILYDENFKETNSFTSKEINSKLDKIPSNSVKITLDSIKETMNLVNPIFKISIKYEKINYEYYGFNTPAHLDKKAIVLQQSSDYVEKNNKYLMLYEDLDLLKSFMEGLMIKENVKNSELPEKYTSDMAKANGDVVNGFKEVINIQKLDDFIKNTESKVKDNVRIVSYTDEGDAILTDLNYDGKDIIAIVDLTRDKFSASENRTKTQYKVTKILKTPGPEGVRYIAMTEQGTELFLAWVQGK